MAIESSLIFPLKLVDLSMVFCMFTGPGSSIIFPIILNRCLTDSSIGQEFIVLPEQMKTVPRSGWLARTGPGVTGTYQFFLKPQQWVKNWSMQNFKLL